jgi:AcrR family transcriptional regulator
MNFQRARSDGQRQSRIDSIVNAAAEIFDQTGYEGMNFSAIAEKTALTRPAVYKYFSSKEDILLKLMSSDFQQWVLSLVKSFKLNKTYTIKEIAEIWAKSIVSRKRMLNLFVMFNTVLENKVSLDALTAFKIASVNSLCAVQDLVSQLFPDATETQVINFVTVQMALALGLYPMTHISRTHKEAIFRAKTINSPPAFAPTYEEILFQLMYFMEKAEPGESKD